MVIAIAFVILGFGLGCCLVLARRSLREALAERRLRQCDIATIAVWPDGEWCYADEVDFYLSTTPCAKSDDYELRNIIVGLDT